MKCDVCDKPIYGTYFIDPWGIKSHQVHDGQASERCFCCGRYISTYKSKASYMLSDGRIICDFCNANAVNNKESGKKAKEEVYSLFEKAKIILPKEKITVMINDKIYAEKVLNRKSFFGLMTSSHTTNGFRVTSEYQVNILSGLHKLMFNAVLGHELMHVYISEQKMNLTLIEEEGLCELISYFIYQASRTKFGQIEMEAMEKSQDPIYGEGFRMMKKMLDKKGSWENLLQSLR
ncbi:MAG: protein DA1 [Bacteroidetes bacterium]|nr:protein DA1 [Bacteroidota bacterium]